MKRQLLTAGDLQMDYPSFLHSASIIQHQHSWLTLLLDWFCGPEIAGHGSTALLGLVVCVRTPQVALFAAALTWQGEESFYHAQFVAEMGQGANRAGLKHKYAVNGA